MPLNDKPRTYLCNVRPLRVKRSDSLTNLSLRTKSVCSGTQCTSEANTEARGADLLLVGLNTRRLYDSQEKRVLLVEVILGVLSLNVR